MFLGRKKELEFLEERWKSGRFEFGCLFGARRIGKTALVGKFLEGKPAIYFQAKEAAEAENRRSFSRILSARLGLPKGYVFSSWDEIFEAVLRLAGGQRFALVIDEYPYLVRDKGKGIPSYLQEFVDHLGAESQLFIILLGSNVSFMEQEVRNAKAPLYRRRTFTYRLGNLPFSEACLFLKGFSRPDASACLAFFGFSPYYLSLLRPEEGFLGNVRRLFFTRGATLLETPDSVLSNGIREKGVYKTVLRAIARGRSTPKRIGEFMEAGSADVSQYLDTLVSEEIVEKRLSFGSVRKGVYRIKDPVLDFLLRVLEDDAVRVSAGYGDVVMKEKEEEIHQFVCRRFEDVSLHYLSELSLEGKLQFPWYPIQNLVVDNSELGRSVEIDGVSDYRGQVLIVECKYTNRKRSAKDFLAMKEDSSIRNFRGKKGFWYVLFSKAGFDESLIQNAPANLRLISEADMFPGFPGAQAAGERKAESGTRRGRRGISG